MSAAMVLEPRSRSALQEAMREIQVMSGTVSYTHLRAHETVLDLVCRLLLEKKKNNTYNA